MTDHNLWVNDIENRFSPTSLTDSTTGSIITATAVISGVTTISGVHTSLWDAYKDLREKLLDGDTALLPQSTTTQRDALTSIGKGTLIYNITTLGVQIYDGTNWISSAGSGTMGDASYGGMYENNETTGSATDSTTKRWITASVRTVDANGLVTFENNSTGDRLNINTGGAGDYDIEAKCDQTNAGGNDTTMTIQVNGVDSTLIDEHASDSGDHRQLTAHGIITLADDDYISMEVVSSTPSDVITVFHVSLSIHRLS